MKEQRIVKDCCGRVIRIGDWMVENPNFPRCDNNFAVWRQSRVSAIREDGYIEATDEDGEVHSAKADSLKIFGR